MGFLGTVVTLYEGAQKAILDSPADAKITVSDGPREAVTLRTNFSNLLLRSSYSHSGLLLRTPFRR